MTREAKVLLHRHANEKDLSELTQLALRAWPAVLQRDDVITVAEAADAAYRAAESMLEAMRQVEGAYDFKPWRGEGK